MDRMSPRLKALWRWVLTISLLALLCVPASAQSRPPRQPPADFDGGFDTRVREVTLHNLLDLEYDEDQAVGDLNKTSDAHFFRVRHRLWGQLKFRSGVCLYSRLTTEWRKYLTPYESPTKTEIIIDNLYLDLPCMKQLPFALRIGRQDLVRGEGFVLLEGSPNDGTRSIYHTAALVTLEGARLGLPQTTLELMAIRNPAWDDYIVANGPTDEQRAASEAEPLVENDETAFGLYVTSTVLAEPTLEAYYFYKEEEEPSGSDPHLRLNTLGARFSGSLPWSLAFAGEGAYQFGRHDPCAAQPAGTCDLASYDHRSYGGYAWLSRSFLAFLRPEFKVGAIYLSGDDCGDVDDEDEVDRGWYPLFGRWPKWSELYWYTLIPEAGRVGYWTNLAALHAGLTVQLSGRTSLSYTYYHLRAPEPLNADGVAGDFFGGGRERGNSHQWKVEVMMTTHVSWHFLIERLAPGDFYEQGRDDAYFVRWELQLTS